MYDLIFWGWIAQKLSIFFAIASTITFIMFISFLCHDEEWNIAVVILFFISCIFLTTSIFLPSREEVYKFMIAKEFDSYNKEMQDSNLKSMKLINKLDKTVGLYDDFLDSLKNKIENKKGE